MKFRITEISDIDKRFYGNQKIIGEVFETERVLINCGLPEYEGFETNTIGDYAKRIPDGKLFDFVALKCKEVDE